MTNGLAFAVVLLAAAIDLRTRRIPNALTFGAAGVAIGLHAWTDGWSGVGASAAGWAIGLALFLPLYALRGLGAGDVKLLAAVGACLGPMGVLSAALFSVLAGGLLALGVATIRGYTGQAFSRLWSMVGFWRVAGLQPVPGLTLEDAPGPRLAYGVAIAAGTLIALWRSYTQATG